MQAWFVSDVHLKGREDERVNSLTRFFLGLAEGRFGPSTHLFLLGDIFDLWVGGDAFFADEYRDLIESVKTVVRSGIQVHYFEGNHDLHLSRFWSDELGVRVYDRAAYFELDGVRFRIEHGDQMNPGDIGYIVLRWILRTRFLQAVIDAIPASWVKAIGSAMSRLSRRWTHGSLLSPRVPPTPSAERSERIQRMILDHAKRAFAQNPFHFLVCGHVHTVLDAELAESFRGAPVRIINLGCWPGADRFDRSNEKAGVHVFSLDEGRPTFRAVPISELN